MSEHIKKEEFLTVYDEHGDAVYRRCLFKTSDHETARDLMQEAFTRTWDYMAQGKEIDNVKAFVFTVANNLIKDHYKKKKAISMTNMGDFDPQRIVDQIENMEAKAEVEEVIRAFGRLKEADRDILTLSMLEGFGPQEISEITNERENTVSVRLHRARSRLRSALKIGNEENEE